VYVRVLSEAEAVLEHVGDEAYQVRWCSAAIHRRPARPHHHYVYDDEGAAWRCQCTRNSKL